MILLKPKTILLFILPLCIFLTFNKHSKDRANTYHGVIWADAAGYYIHQPIWFIYGNDAKAFPKNIELNTGNGFYLDTATNKVITKYPCGVAILQTPFFLASHFLAKVFHFEADGFSKIYSYGLYFAGIVYCCLGLFLLSRFLSQHFSPAVSVIAPLLFLAGTNLFYYSIDAPGMSHVYSFFLFCLIIYLTPTLTTKPRFSIFLLFFCCVTLATLTRPTNILIVLFPFFYNIKNKSEFVERILLFLKNKFVVLGTLLIASFLTLPQILYWNSTTGKLISYSYGNESVIFWNNPKLLEIWFCTNNGLFLYTPLIFISIVGIILMMKKKEWSGYFIAILFLVISYIFASWWNWWFGCSFGARSFVEYYSLLIIPFCYLLEYTKDKKVAKYTLVLAIAFCCYLNLNMEYYYDGCFYGDTWDFSSYLKLLNS